MLVREKSKSINTKLSEYSEEEYESEEEYNPTQKYMVPVASVAKTKKHKKFVVNTRH